MGYFLWKSYLFFLFLKIRYTNDIIVTDRYIYDHLVHFQLANKKRAAIFRIFQKLLPTPNISFILYSDFESTKTARPNYWPEYLKINLANYRLLKELFPQSIFIEANQIESKARSVFSIVENYLEGDLNIATKTQKH